MVKRALKASMAKSVLEVHRVIKESKDNAVRLVLEGPKATQVRKVKPAHRASEAL